MKQLTIILSLFFLYSSAQAQRPKAFKEENLNKTYAIKWKFDGPLLATSTGLTLSMFLLKNKDLLDPVKVNNLKINDLNKFDRSAVNHNSKTAGTISDYLFFGSIGSSLLVYASPNIRKEWKEVTLIMAETYLISSGLTGFTKNAFARSRPFLYDKTRPIEERITADGENSFVSGHTSMTATATFMMAKLLVDYHPNTKLKPLIWTLGAGIPAATGLLRYKTGKHFFSDIIMGYAVGALSGYFVPHIHKKIADRKAKSNNSTVDFFGERIYF